MARRRLQAILATTVITVGLSAGPALGQELAGLTETLEETVASTTEEVATATEEVASTTEQVVGTVTGGLAEQATSSDEPTDAASPDEATTSGSSDPAEAESEDDALIDLGTGDGTLDVELDVDLAPSDEDGSPQLEVDGGLTVGGEHVDVGGLTDPIEDAIDPDEEPAPEQGGSSDETVDYQHEGSGGFLAGGGVVAAGDSPRPATTDTTGSSTRSSGGQGFTSFSLANGGGDSFGLQRFGGGTMDLDAVADPEVAPPAAAPGDAGFDEFPEAPEVAEGSEGVTPTVLATQAPASDDSPLATILRALAGALVLATGAAWTRATRDA